MCVLVTHLFPILCDPMDSSSPGSSVHGILQTRILEWVAIPSPGDLPDPGIEPRSPALQADSLPSEPPGKPILSKQTYSVPIILKKKSSLEFLRSFHCETFQKITLFLAFFLFAYHLLFS